MVIFVTSLTAYYSCADISWESHVVVCGNMNMLQDQGFHNMLYKTLYLRYRSYASL